MKKIKIMILALISLVMMTACESKEDESIQGNTSNEYINSQDINLTMMKPKTINPITNMEKSVSYIMNLVYDGLFTVDKDYNVIPQLVKEYEVSQDGTSIDIKLNDAKWHNSNDVTSYDVEFTIDLIKKNQNSPYSQLVENISSVYIINESQFTINFKNNYPFSVETLIFPIVSKSQLQGLSNDEINQYKHNLVGNGMYRIQKYEERDYMILGKNEEYYKELGDNAKTIKVHIAPDKESQVSMVMGLQSDIAEISLTDFSKFYEKQFNITNYQGRDYESLVFNFENPLFKDINFRKAIQASIDKNRIIEEGYMSDAKSVNYPLNYTSKYYNKELKVQGYDKQKSKTYLEKVDFNTDKQLEDKDTKNESNDNTEKKGEEIDKKENNIDDKKSNVQEKISSLNLNIIVNKNNPERIKTSYIIYENLKDIGIKSTVRELDDDEMNKALQEKEYDIALTGWELSVIPDSINIIQSLGYEDDKLNNYINSLLNAKSESQTKDVYSSIQKYINDNAILVSLVIKDNYVVKNKRLEGTIYSNSLDIYNGIENIGIPKSK